MRQTIFSLALLCLLLAPPRTVMAQEAVLPVAVLAEALTRYQTILKEKGVSAEEITDLKSPLANRQVADLVILQQALIAGGLRAHFAFIPVPNAVRGRESVRSGLAVLSGEDLFSMAFTDDVFMSPPVIPNGAFVKGVYGLPDNAALQAVRTLDDLKKLSAVSSSEWKADWKTLKEIAPARLISVAQHQSMFKVVQYRNIDFTLYEFPATSDLSQIVDGIRLVPVPGVKVVLRDSRHFMISRRNPDGERVYEALCRGLTVLQQQGVIERLFTDVGFYHPELKDWTVLNP